MVKPLASATYQGLYASDVEYAIHLGLAPDDGWVKLDPEFVDIDQALAISDVPVEPWQEGRTQPPNTPIHIQSLVGRTIGGIPAPPQLSPAGNFSGLKAFGDLALQSESGGAITIREVFLHPDTAHHSGRRDELGKQTVMVRLTDARIFWPNGGDLYGHVNVSATVRGKEVFDPRTILPNGQPFALSQVMDWLIQHLPGPPRVRGILDACAGKEDPRNIVAEHDRPLPVIAQLLTQYGLTFRRNLDGTYTLKARKSGAATQKAGADLVNIQASVERPYPPAACRVVGAKIRRNIVRQALPVSRDTDGGRVYPLDEVVSRYTTMDKVLSNLTVPESRRFEFLPEAVRRIAREDWGRLYQISTAIRQDEELSHLDLPMHDVAFAGAGAAVKVVTTGGGAAAFEALAPSVYAADGSGTQEVRLRPPIVEAVTYEQRRLTSNEFKAVVPDLERQLANRRDQLQRRELPQLEREIEIAEAAIADKHYRDDSENWRRVVMTAIEQSPALKARLRALGRALATKRAELEGLTEAIEKFKFDRDVIVGRTDFAPSEKYWMIAPQRELPEGAYTVEDRERGIIRVNVPVGFIEPFIAMQPEHFRVIALPTLRVTYGVEHNTLTDFDRFSIVARRKKPDSDEIETLSAVGETTGGVRWPDWEELSAGIKAPTAEARAFAITVKDEKIRLYLDERGLEFNGQNCRQEARRRAAVALAETANQILGTVFTYEGWHAPDPTDDTVESVTWKNLGGKPVTAEAHNSFYHTATRRGSSKKIGHTIAIPMAGLQGDNTVLRVGL